MKKYKDIDFNESFKISSSKQDKASSCPSHLFKQKIKDINTLRKEQKHYEIFSTIKKFSEEYDDEKSINLVASNLYRLILEDKNKYWDTNLIQYIFDKAEEDFFNPILCSSVVGILLLSKTPTEKKIIEEIGNRMIKMAPGIFKNAIEILPEEIYHKDLRKKFKAKFK